MVLRIVLIAVVVFLVLAWLRSLRRPAAAQRQDRSDGASSRRMVQCAHCAVHLPADESLADGSQHYCSAEHRDAARRAAPRG